MICLVIFICYFMSDRTAACGDYGSGVIVLDPGHGGVDGGSGGQYGGILEKEINLRLSLMLKTLLEEKGYTVVMTRETDIALDNLNKSSSSRHMRDLIARSDIVNRSGADVFLSIHVNSLAGNTSQSGSIVFYGKRYVQSKVLADFLQKELNAVKAGGRERGQNRPLPGRYHMLNSSRVPGVIVETAFITNPRERALLATDEFLLELAAAVAGGTDAFLKSETREESVIGC